jgi:hypothetical protein
LTRLFILSLFRPEVASLRNWRSAAFSLLIYLSNFRTIGSGDTVPASLLPIILLTEGSIYFNSYEQHYEKNGNRAYFFHHTRGRTVSSYPLATGFLATPIYALPVLGWKIIHKPRIEEWASFAGVMEKSGSGSYNFNFDYRFLLHVPLRQALERGAVVPPKLGRVQGTLDSVLSPEESVAFEPERQARRLADRKCEAYFKDRFASL